MSLNFYLDITQHFFQLFTDSEDDNNKKLLLGTSYMWHVHYNTMKIYNFNPLHMGRHIIN